MRLKPLFRRKQQQQLKLLIVSGEIETDLLEGIERLLIGLLIVSGEIETREVVVPADEAENF